MKLVKRLTDNYNKNPESNIGKLLSIIDFELARLKDTYKLIDSYRAIDNATGQTLDNIGKNVMQERGGMDDVTYRLFLKTRIKSNLSGGQIKTINEILLANFGENFLGIREVWGDASYSNEPASFEVSYLNFFDKVKAMYQFGEDDPWFLNGIYFLDGTRKLDGGYSFYYPDFEQKIIDYIELSKGIIKQVTSAGVSTWWNERVPIETLINISNNVTIINKEQYVSDVSIVNDYFVEENQLTEFGGSPVYFSGDFLFDGSNTFDGHNDFIVNDVIIIEVSA